MLEDSISLPLSARKQIKDQSFLLDMLSAKFKHEKIDILSNCSIIDGECERIEIKSIGCDYSD